MTHQLMDSSVFLHIIWLALLTTDSLIYRTCVHLCSVHKTFILPLAVSLMYAPPPTLHYVNISFFLSLRSLLSDFLQSSFLFLYPHRCLLHQLIPDLCITNLHLSILALPPIRYLEDHYFFLHLICHTHPSNCRYHKIKKSVQ